MPPDDTQRGKESAPVTFATAAEYKAAIATLNNSTQETNTRIDGISQIQHSQEKRSRSLSPKGTPGQKPHSLHRQQSRLGETLTADLKDARLSASEDLRKSIATTTITTDDTLARHDHQFVLLDEQLGSQDAVDTGQDLRREKLLAALRYTYAETIRLRLNRCYLQALTTEQECEDISKYNQIRDDSIQAKTDLLQQDLRMLYSEIDDVAQMLVMHEHGNRLHSVGQRLNRITETLNDKQTQHAVEQISAMCKKIEALTVHVERLQSYRLVHQKLGSCLDTIEADLGRSRIISTKAEPTSQPHSNTTSLHALRQYLGLDSDTAGKDNKSKQCHFIFADITSHVKHTLAIQAEQAGHIQRTDDFKQKGDNLHEASYRTKLDELDDEVARIKSRIDSINL
ncbi:hypothetical protein LTR64_005038 [Lithohypha guttulata]|uniref:Uncharacterized protein n=1 Tax=Lithohypha guttulata TaxID=1690604 RepID=A0AAN7YBX9_9EURO|nr:hypothetical protein LTR51_005127 [Lithohypha guttulata]KAK5087870.1 hypothetical protein LTR05_002085 [Lithohypha guttulata]